MDKQKMLSRALWLWVVGGIAAYIVQFRDFAGPILNILGLG
jgi:hypothetical protein